MKNKLISKNPVQRFQQGKKIVKAQSGAVFNVLRNLYYGYDRDAHDKRVINEGVKRTTTARLAAITDPSQLPRNWYVDPENGAVYQRNSDGGRTLIGKPSFHTNLTVNNGTPPAGNGRRRNTLTTTTTPAAGNGIGNTPTYYTTRAYRNAVLPEGLNSRDAVKRFQEETLRMTGRDLDGIWGDRTQAAYERWKNGQGSTPGGTTSVNPGMTPEQLLTGASVLSRNGTIPAPPSRDGRFSREYISQELFSRPIETPTTEYDRSDIRQYLRDLGYNPYQFTGAQRRALRMVRNGVGTDSDKAIVKQMGIFKKGGQLISKNPIERFKVNFR